MADKCTARTEVYSRVCGFFRPVQQWNKGKKSEYADRVPYSVESGCLAAGDPGPPPGRDAPGGDFLEDER